MLGLGRRGIVHVLEMLDLGSRGINCTIYAAKTKTLMSYVV